jgi:hypothetical protein
MAEAGEDGSDPRPARRRKEMTAPHRHMPGGYLAALYRPGAIR